MREKHRANLIISHEMLLDVLGLPKAALIITTNAGGDDAMRGQLSILVEHESLPLVKSLEVPYNIYTVDGKDGKVVFCGWDL